MFDDDPDVDDRVRSILARDAVLPDAHTTDSSPSRAGGD
jgi:hypothetical protein